MTDTNTSDLRSALSGYLPFNQPERLPESIKDHDAADRLSHSLQVLKDSAQQGDLASAVELALRLLAGKGAEAMPQAAVQLMNEAARRGSPEAVTWLATYHACGIMPQSWEKALHLLSHAAQDGWKPAQAQLLLLSQDEAARERLLQDDTGDVDWTKIKNTVDLHAWLQATKKNALSTSPEICTMSQFLPPHLCDWIINLADPWLERALVYSSATHQEEANETRTNRNYGLELSHCDVTTFIVQKKIGLTVNVNVSHMEPLAVLNYQPGESISAHYDFVKTGNPEQHAQVVEMGQRYVTFITYLNENYDAGETVFNKLNLSNKGKKGDAIYFINSDKDGQPDLRTLHTGTPPDNGEKWIITQFIREKPIIGFGI